MLTNEQLVFKRGERKKVILRLTVEKLSNDGCNGLKSVEIDVSYFCLAALLRMIENPAERFPFYCTELSSSIPDSVKLQSEVVFFINKC